ncbi:hypothetical protein [Luedemannella helvata]|uniref:Uncharacterized protein n=1 Tax=Luedemannella helvata TaxID=349315 RepID=A0ABP4WH79_9ACTN
MIAPDDPTNPNRPTDRADAPWHAAPADPWASEAPIDPWTGTGGVAGVAATTDAVATVDAPPAPAGAQAPRPAANGGRRGWLLALGAAGVVIVLAAATAAVIWWRSGDQAVEFTQLSGPKFVPTGEENTYYTYARTAVTDERAYLAWVSGDNIKVTGADLESGKPVKQPVTVGPGDEVEGLVPVADALVMYVNTRSPSGKAIYVLDAATLATRWQRTLGANEWIETFSSYVVLVDPDADRLRRVDVKGTGSDVWNKQFEGATLRLEEPVGNASAPAWLNGYPLAASADRKLLVIKDGTIQVVDPASGDTTSTVTGIPSTSSTLAAGGVFYAIRYNSNGYEVQAFDLSGKQQPKTVYSAEPKAYLDELSLCGGGVCVTQTITGTQGVTVVALPTGDEATPRWQLPFSDVDGITALGDETMVIDASDAHTWIVGEDGKVRYDRTARIGTRVTSGSVLLWSALGSSAASVGLEGYTVADTSARPLGTADGVYASRCTWSTRVLACPAGDGLAWWTFAE